MERYSAEELAHLVQDTIDWRDWEIEGLREECKRLKEDAKKIVSQEYEKQIASLEKRLQLSYGEFNSQRELDAYNKFVNEHLIEREEHKCNGGRVPYIIPNHTGIGTIFKVKCPICGEEKDITDSEAW
jgi:rubrerythrin